MTLMDKITEELKNAMRSKDEIALQSIRAIKSELLLLRTKSGSPNTFPDKEEMKILQKLIKQRKESAKIFREQNRIDLAEPEEAQAKIIEGFLPEQLDEEKIREYIKEIISNTGSEGIKDMGKVMGIATSKMAGQADGKTISILVKEILTS
ncbi:MAG: glutamyl-tRNA amidotransferase [Flavobacteriaceae bacterium]|nr:glutamyl-tRNA amidotransferase [Flavobacteriaceae bacterium]|tara:strand:- start:5425 stop:5877 length:453 start_codon:yes stop_codon:yes gene_type:complete